MLANILDHLDLEMRIAMGDIHNDAIRARFQHRFYAAHFLIPHTHRRTDRQTPFAHLSWLLETA